MLKMNEVSANIVGCVCGSSCVGEGEGGGGSLVASALLVGEEREAFLGILLCGQSPEPSLDLSLVFVDGQSHVTFLSPLIEVSPHQLYPSHSPLVPSLSSPSVHQRWQPCMESWREWVVWTHH